MSAGDHELHVGDASRISGSAAASVGIVRATSLGRLPGSSATVGAVRLKAAPAQKRLAALDARRQLDQRMADEFHRHTGGAIQIHFERKDHEHPVDVLLHRLHAAGPPRPQLRADVIHDRNPERVDRGHEPEVEVREIDRDEDVGPRACAPRRPDAAASRRNAG